MRVAVYSAKAYDRSYLDGGNRGRHQFIYLLPALDEANAVLASGHRRVCIFVNDRADAAVLTALAGMGATALVLRCAGYNQVDLAAAARLGMRVARVPSYSHRAIAEHSVALLLMLARKLHQAYNRVREGNFSIDGLIGFELAGKTVGLVGTGAIGAATARILLGFGCRVVASDPHPDPAIADDLRGRGVEYLPLAEVLARSTVVSVHLPLSSSSTAHVIDAGAIALMRPGALLINTSRGGVLDTSAASAALKTGQLGGLGLDVYEGEAGLFFEDRSDRIILDDRFTRLQAFPNVVITGHQAFLTHEALSAIADTTLANLDLLERNEPCANAMTA